MEQEDVISYGYELGNELGLGENDMLFLIYDDGESWYWLPSPVFYDIYTGDGLQDILNVSFQPDERSGGIDNALVMFFEQLNACYPAVYENLSENDNNPSDILPISESLELVYSSGAGAWQTNLILYSDGSFEGSYYDADMGDSDERYPSGTVYICSFIGHFSDISQMNDYTYSLTLERGDMYITTGGSKWIENGVRNIPEEWIEDGVRYIPTGPIGLV